MSKEKRFILNIWKLNLKRKKTKEIFINYLLVFDDVVDFLSLDVLEGIVVANIRARSFTVNAKHI
jgi:hypothetical protein